ncbi:MAG: hypothetical protein NC337_14120 [Roseburia sp.]|nr:hypothetical protein [Roseburia sp.]
MKPLKKQEKDMETTTAIFRQVCNEIDESAVGINTILENSRSLEGTRTETVAIVQNSASLSQENSASLEEIMASIENIYDEIGGISEKAKYLESLSQEMMASVDVFHI